jgi:phenylalanyl-tRNA synthetase beta chain
VARFPIVRRDIAVVVDEGVAAAEVIGALEAAKPPHVERIVPFDVYRGAGLPPGRKSLAILVLMQDTARTLTDADIDATVAALVEVLHQRFGATLRQ